MQVIFIARLCNKNFEPISRIFLIDGRRHRKILLMSNFLTLNRNFRTSFKILTPFTDLNTWKILKI